MENLKWTNTERMQLKEALIHFMDTIKNNVDKGIELSKEFSQNKENDDTKIHLAVMDIADEATRLFKPLEKVWFYGLYVIKFISKEELEEEPYEGRAFVEFYANGDLAKDFGITFNYNGFLINKPKASLYFNGSFDGDTCSSSDYLDFDTNMNVFLDDFERYIGLWDRLGLLETQDLWGKDEIELDDIEIGFLKNAIKYLRHENLKIFHNYFAVVNNNVESVYEDNNKYTTADFMLVPKHFYLRNFRIYCRSYEQSGSERSFNIDFSISRLAFDSIDKKEEIKPLIEELEKLSFNIEYKTDETLEKDYRDYYDQYIEAINLCVDNFKEAVRILNKIAKARGER